MIEIMVVMAVMGLLLLLVVTRGPPHSANLTLNAAGGDVAGALRADRGAAIAAGRPINFLIDPASATYGTAGAMRGLPHGIMVSVKVRPKGPIVLHPDGSASAADIRLSLGDIAETITIDWLTGRIGIGTVQAVAQ